MPEGFFTNKRLLMLFLGIWVVGLILGGIAKHYTVSPDPRVKEISLNEFKNSYSKSDSVALLTDVNNRFVEGYLVRNTIPGKTISGKPDFYFKLDSLSQVSAYVTDTLSAYHNDRIPMRFEARTNNAMKILSGTFIAIFLLCTYIMGLLIIRIIKKFFHTIFIDV